MRPIFSASLDAQFVALRDIAGPTFEPLTVPRSETITVLAQAAYNERQLPSGEMDPARLAVLADALEEAGAHALVVEHLQGPGPHWRGCWVVDACLEQV